MNLLSKETSPYLLQHALNPVHWMPWSEVIFELAEQENKPILLSIGYSSCHWCHVMEHESFEDEETAELMNTLFINVKVDREEFPDVDHFYMDAVQAMTGSGGWPLNVFLTPTKKAFYGGTYFPKVRMHNRASWKETLINVSQYFQQNRSEVEVQANKLFAHLENLSKLGQNEANQSDSWDNNVIFSCREMTDKILKHADKEEGGFGQAPKFPSTFTIQYLLDYYALFNDEMALKQALLSLDKMMMGGIYDQIGGGFSRYSTDKYWQAPHFEKMLYDNALLLEVYANAYQITKKETYKNVIQQTVEWLIREMKSNEGGFYSAQDADSEGVEGKYYTWSWDELKSLLKDDFEAFAKYYQVIPNGNWEHTNILWTTQALHNEANDEFLIKLPSLHHKLLSVRSNRVKPLTDDKQLLGWNALMSKALIKAGLILEQENYLTLAQENIDFLLTNFASKDSLFWHTYKGGQVKIAAYLDDLVYLTNACISLSQATAETRYLLEAKKITYYLLANFKEHSQTLFNFTNQHFQQVGVPKQDVYDGALPSPNSTLVGVLFYLGFAFEEFNFLDLADQMLKIGVQLAMKHPTSFAVWANQFQLKKYKPKELVIVGKESINYFKQIYTKTYLPHVIYLNGLNNDSNVANLANKTHGTSTFLFLCEENACLPQFMNPEDVLLAIN